MYKNILVNNNVFPMIIQLLLYLIIYLWMSIIIHSKLQAVKVRRKSNQFVLISSEYLGNLKETIHKY